MVTSWILLGMPGSGKSSIGRSLAARTGRAFLDTDVLIEQRFGRRISEIFRVYGEGAFRDHETSVLRALGASDAVLATGGGIVSREENWSQMRRIGITAFLDVDAQELARRLESGRRKRPLLADDDWQDRLGALCRDRREAYLQADLRLVRGGLDLEGCVDLALREFQAAERLRSERAPKDGSAPLNPADVG